MVFPLYKAALHVCLLPPTWAGRQGLGWRRFPCHEHKSSTSSFPLHPLLILSRSHPFSPSCHFSELLTPVLVMCPHHSLPPRLFIPAQILFPLHLYLNFHSAAGVSKDPRDATQTSCSTFWESPLIETGTDFGLKLRWAGFHLDVSQASLPQSHRYPYMCYATTSKGVRINTEALVP